MESGRRSGLYWDILSRRGLSSMIIGGGLKSVLPKSSGKGSLKH